MVLEVTALAAAVKSTAELVKEAAGLAQAIRSGLRVDNQEQKEQLQRYLSELQTSLEQLGELAVLAERYARIHEDVLALLREVEHAQRSLLDDPDSFRTKSNTRYTMNWRAMEAQFLAIEGARGPVEEAVNNRINWFSERDRDQIAPHLTEFDNAFHSGQRTVRFKAASDLRNDVDNMTRPLETAERLIRSTLYDDVFPALQKSLRAGGGAS
jgi:hypothetical protein